MTFGHEIFEEQFATKVYSHKDRKYFYEVWKRMYCARCGDVIKLTKVGQFTRTELLKRGWFFEDDSDDFKEERFNYYAMKNHK